MSFCLDIQPSSHCGFVSPTAYLNPTKDSKSRCQWPGGKVAVTDVVIATISPIVSGRPLVGAAEKPPSGTSGVRSPL